MSPKLLRVLFAFLFLLTFSLLLASSYLRAEELVEARVLSDSSCSLLSRLCGENLSAGTPYLLDPSRLPSLSFRERVGGRELEFRVWLEEEGGRRWGPLGPLPPGRRVTCSLLVPVSLLENRPVPGRMGLEAWWA
jgi:hypothetical protein